MGKTIQIKDNQMATLRYKKHPDRSFEASTFNMTALAEVLTGDDSAFFRELDVLIKGEWKDLSQAFKDRDLITDNYNRYFFEPKTEEDRKRGYTE